MTDSRSTYLHNFACVSICCNIPYKYTQDFNHGNGSDAFDIDDWSMENMANELQTGQYDIQ